MRLLSAGALLAAIVIASSAAVGQTTTGPRAKPDPKKDVKKNEPKGKLEPVRPGDVPPPPPPKDYPKEVLGKSLEAWAKEIKDNPDPSARETAIKTVPLFGPDCTQAASANLLYALTSDKDYSVRLTALAHVPIIGFDDQKEIDAAIKAMTDMARGQQNHTRYEAIMALANCGLAGKKAVPTLSQFCVADRSSWQIRKAACYALGSLGGGQNGPDSQTINALLVRATRDDAAQVRREAINSILVLTPPVQTNQDLFELRKGLTACKGDRDKTIGVWARVALMRLETERVKSDNVNVKELVALFKDKDPQVRLEAVQGMGMMGSELAFRAGDLMAVADTDAEVGVRATAIWSLSQMPAASSESLPFLSRLKKVAKEDAIRQAIDEAVASITGRQKEAAMDKEKEKAGDPKKGPLPPKSDAGFPPG